MTRWHWLYEPDLLLFQAGVDGLAEDALGRLELSREGMRYRNKMVFDYVLDNEVPCVVFMGGGYSKPIDHTVDSLVDLFRGCQMLTLCFHEGHL